MGPRPSARVLGALALAGALAGAPAGAAEPEGKPWTLEALQAAAEAADPRVLAAAAELARRRGAAAEARAATTPSVAWTLGVTAPTPELRNDPARLDDVAPGSRLRDGDLGAFAFTGHLGADLSWPVYGFGRLEARREAAERTTAAGLEAARAAKARAARDAAEVFWAWQLARRAAQALDEDDRQLAGARERLERLVEQGPGPATAQDLAHVEVLRAELASSRTRVVAARDVALEAARAIAGLPTGAPFALAPAAVEPPTVTLAPLQRYVELALEGRGDVAAAREALRAREAELVARRRASWPELVVTGFADLNWSPSATPQTNPFAWDPYNRLAAGLGVALRGNLELAQARAHRAQAEAEADRARAEVERVTRAARLEVALAHAGLRAALDRTARLRDQEAAARRWLAHAEQAFDAGRSGARPVLEAAQAAARAAAARLEAAHDAQVGLADLTLAVGEEARPAPPVN